MTIEIRHAGPDDAALFARVDEDVFDGPIVPERLAAYLADPGHLMVLALADGEVIGQAAGVIHRHPDLPTELYIDNLGVAPRFLRRGIATRLLERLFELGRERGCKEAWVGTELDNDPANGLYGRYAAQGRFAFYLWDI